MQLLAGLQPLSPERARLCIPHEQLPAFMEEETEDARKWVLNWISVLEPLRHAKGRSELFQAVARTMADKPGNVKRRYYAWVAGVKGECSPAWEKLIDRRLYPRRGDKALDVRFIDHWRGLREQQRRLNDGCRQAHRDLLSQLAAWEARPHDPTLVIPGYKRVPSRDSYCEVSRQRVPEGWSYRNLTRKVPRKAQILNIIVGPKAASALLPSNPATRAGLAYRQIVFSDDQEYDNRIASPYTRGELMRPQGFNLLDYFTAHFETYGVQFRRRDEDDGRKVGINQEFYVWTVLADLMQNGFRDDDAGTLIIREHGTAKGYAKQDGYGQSFDDIIHHITGGRVTLDASGRFDQPQFAQMFLGKKTKQSGGNYRYKAPLESAFHAVRTRSAGLLGDTGNRYQIEPEATDALASHHKKLWKAIEKMPVSDRDEIYRLLRMPGVHKQDEWVRLTHLVYGAVNARRDHELEGWYGCGFVVPAVEYSVPGHETPALVTREQFGLLPAEQQHYIETFGKWRSLVLSPAEARALCLAGDRNIRKLSWSIAVAALPISWAYPKRKGKEGGVKVNARGEIVIRDPERFGPESLVYLGTLHRGDRREQLRPGEEVYVHVCPFAPDEALVLDLQGRYQGTIKLMPRACASDTAARLRNQGAINEYAADLHRDSHRRQAERLAGMADDLEHDRQVARGEIRPEPVDLDRARRIHDLDAADEAEEKGVVTVRPDAAHHHPAPSAGTGRYDNIFANNPDLDQTPEF